MSAMSAKTLYSAEPAVTERKSNIFFPLVNSADENKHCLLYNAGQILSSRHQVGLKKESDVSFQMSAGVIKLSGFVRSRPVIRHYVCLTSPEKSWATQFNYKKV